MCLNISGFLCQSNYSGALLIRLKLLFFSFVHKITKCQFCKSKKDLSVDLLLLSWSKILLFIHSVPKSIKWLSCSNHYDNGKLVYQLFTVILHPHLLTDFISLTISSPEFSLCTPLLAADLHTLPICSCRNYMHQQVHNFLLHICLSWLVCIVWNYTIHSTWQVVLQLSHIHSVRKILYAYLLMFKNVPDRSNFPFGCQNANIKE